MNFPISEDVLIALITVLGGVVGAVLSAIIAKVGETKKERWHTFLLAGLILGLVIGLVVGLLVSFRACPRVKAVVSNRQNIPPGETAYITAIVFSRDEQVFNYLWATIYGSVPGPPTDRQTIEYIAPTAVNIDTITVRVWNRTCYDSGSVDIQIMPKAD